MAAPTQGGSTPSDRPVRVLHLLYSLGVGGMEMGVHKLLTGLDRAQVETSVCSLTPDENASVWPRDNRVITLPRRRGNDPFTVIRLVRLMRHLRPDIVHTHSWGTLCEGVSAARLAGVSCVVHGEHGTMELRPRNVWVQSRVWRRVARVLAVSSVLADRMSQVTGFERRDITVIRNGVDLSRFGGVARERGRQLLGLSPDAYVAGTVGRLVPVKDQDNLLEAFARVAGSVGRFHGLIAGDGPLRTQLAQRIHALGLETRVRLLGERSDVPEIMSALDVFVLSSKSEGLSNTVLEAMASGLPVVATAVGGNGELVVPDTTGLLVPAGNPQAIADAILQLDTDAIRRARMGVASRARAEAEFSIEGMLLKYTQLYKALAPADARASAEYDAVGAGRL